MQRRPLTTPPADSPGSPTALLSWSAVTVPPIVDRLLRLIAGRVMRDQERRIARTDRVVARTERGVRLADRRLDAAARRYRSRLEGTRR